MSDEAFDILRVDIGNGVFVRVPAATSASTASTAGCPNHGRLGWKVHAAALAVGVALIAVALLRPGATPTGSGLRSTGR